MCKLLKQNTLTNIVKITQQNNKNYQKYKVNKIQILKYMQSKLTK